MPQPGTPEYSERATDGYLKIGFPARGGRWMVPVEFGCWVDLFEMSHYRGRRRRVFGPANFAALRSRLPSWGISIDSLVVGPGALVRIYSSADPANPGTWVSAGQVVEDLVDQKIPDELDSVQIQVRAPADRSS